MHLIASGSQLTSVILVSTFELEKRAETPSNCYSGIYFGTIQNMTHGKRDIISMVGRLVFDIH